MHFLIRELSPRSNTSRRKRSLHPHLARTRRLTTSSRFLNGGRGDFKIPSTLYYHSDGKFCGAGDPEQWDDVERLNCVGW